ncbi:MAG: MFS transporter [Gemmatimonadota bacterium]
MTTPKSGLSSRSPARALFIIVLIDLIGFGIVLPLLPGRAAEFTPSETAIGFLVASFSCMQFLVAPWWGRLSDRVGRRPILLLSLGASTVSYMLFAVAGSYWILLVSRVLAGAIGATVNVAQAYLADITPPQDRSRAMALIGVAFGLGFIIGPAIAGVSSLAGTAVPGFVAAALCLLSLIFGWYALQETRVQLVPTSPAPIPWRRTIVPYSVTLLSVVGFAVITVVFPLFTKEQLHFERYQTSALFVLMGLSSAVVQAWLIGRLAPRMGERSLMLLGSLLLSIGLAVIPVSFSAGVPIPLRLPVLMLALAALSAGTGFVWPAVAGYISRLTPESEQGHALGALHSVASIARVIGPVLVGLVGEQGGYDRAFLTGAGLAFLAAIGSLFATRSIVSLRQS